MCRLLRAPASGPGTQAGAQPRPSAWHWKALCCVRKHTLTLSFICIHVNQMPESSCGGFSLSWKTKLPQPRGRTLTLSGRGKHPCLGRLGDRGLHPWGGHHHRRQSRPHTGVCAAAGKSMEAGGQDRSGSCDSQDPKGSGRGMGQQPQAPDPTRGAA